MADLNISPELERRLRSLHASARPLRHLGTSEKNGRLRALAEAIEGARHELIRSNAEDLRRLPSDAAAAFRDRLTLTNDRIKAMAESLRQVAALPDPVNEVVESRSLQNGLQVKRVRAPLGVILMIFESRPNVILEAFSLAFKSGNAIALRGGSDSQSTATAMYALMKETLGPLGFIPFYGFEDYDRALVEKLLQRQDLFDVVVPRGGEKLIAFVQKTSRMPIIKNDRGLCHTYVDEDADLEMATEIVKNAKTQRPGVCNALETVLVHAKVAQRFLPKLYAATAAQGLKWRVDEGSLKILNGEKNVEPAVAADFDTEHLDLILNCALVASLEEAMAHIERHGSRHSEAIVTASETKARRFQEEIDAAAVYWNASTRFTDGFELGLGGELGISTQKLHVRGPVGLRELTTPRWLIDGTGQIRK